MKRVFLILIFAVLCGGYAMAYDFSAVCESGQTLYYNITDSSAYTDPFGVPINVGTVSVTFGDSHPTGDLIIPRSVNSGMRTHYIVTSIGDQAFLDCHGLTSVTISNSVSRIGNSAFYGCYALTSVTIPNSVTSIGSVAFSSCSQLTSVTIPNSVTSIGRGAFYDCRRLTSVYYTGTIAEWCEITFANGESNPLCNAHNLYINNSLVTNLVIPNIVTEIKANAFYGATCLTSVTIPNSVTSIGQSAFSGCSSLTEMTIPFVGGSATSSTHFGYIFGTESYTGGTSVSYSSSTTYYIPSSLRSVTITGGDLPFKAFLDCTMLISVRFPNATRIGQSAFSGCSGLTSVNIPNSVTSIGGSAFSGCSSLTSINIPNSVTSIGSEAFAHCSGLTEMTIPFVGSNATSTGQSESNLFGWIFDRITDIYSTTDNCSGCVIVNQNYGLDYTRCYYIPSALRTVNVTGGRLLDGAFYNCSMLTSVTIGNGVTSIGIGAFGNCTGITTVNFNATNCTEIGTSDYHVFSECTSLTTINIGNDVTNIPNGAFYGCSALTTVNYNATNCTSMGSSDYPVFANCTSLASLNIGNSVRNIPAYAFKGCSGLPSVTIPNSVTSIGSQAFAGCNGLTSVYYTGNIGQWCGITFENAGANPLPYAHNLYINNSLVTELDIPQTVTEIKPNTFCGATCLTSVTIPSSVTSIGEYAFSNCNMISVTLPNSITSISNGTFDGCSRLASLTIPDSITSIGNSAFNSCSGIRNLIIGREVASIGSSAFEGCSGIITMKVKAEYPPNVGAGCFNGVSTSAIVKVPCNSEPYYNAAQYWNQFTNIQGDFEYEITVSSSNSTMGNVTVTQEPSCTNSTAIIMATANSGYRFLQWNDGNTDNPRTVTLTSDANYIANFASLYPTVYNSFEAEACGSYTWNGQTYTESGYYQQTFTAANSADSIVTLTLTIHAMPIPTIAQSGTLDACNPSTVTLSVGNYSTYQWSNGATAATVEISTPGYYFVEVSDAYGCTGISEQTNIGLSNNLPEAPQISVVGMNSENHNVVAWSALDNTNVNGYRIYRENNVADVYEPMATVDASQSSWTDETADPSARAYRYKVTAFDECGGESPMSDYHKTMHLTINRGIGNAWNLIWSHYEGFTFGTYRIYRGTSPSNMTMIGEVPSNLNSYTDNTNTTNEGFYYQVEVVRNTRSRDAEISSRSNIVDNGIITEYTITVISANPSRGTVTGGGTYPAGTVITIEATAFDGYEFVSWSDENTENPRQITVTADATYIASFIPATGIEENASLEISLFPNPATDILNITYSETISEIEIVNTLGQVVKRIEVNADNAVCDVEDLTSGVYVVKVSTLSLSKGANVSQRKFIKE